jgi:hypothetical protein
MTKRRRNQPSKFRDYVTGKSLSALDTKLKIADRQKKAAKTTTTAKKGKSPSEVASQRVAEKDRRNRVLKRKLQKTQFQNEIWQGVENPTSGVETATAMVSLKPNLESQSSVIPVAPEVLINRQNLSVDEWQKELSGQLNKIGIGDPELTEGNKTVSLLSPALITERGGLCFVTNLLGARKENGEIITPREFQLPSMNLTKEKQATISRKARSTPKSIIDDAERILELPQNAPPSSPNQKDQLPPSEKSLQNQSLSGVSALSPSQATTTTAIPQADIAAPNLPNLSRKRRRTLPLSPNLNQQSKRKRLTTTTTTSSTATSTAPISGQRQTPTNNNQDRPDGFDLFYNPNQPSYLSALDIKKFKRKNDNISRHKPFLASFKRNPIISTGLYTHLFADTIAAYGADYEINNDYAYILVVICALSKQLFTAPIYFNTQEEVTPALENIFRQLDLPGHTFFLTDRGKEFEINSWPMLERWGMTPVYLRGRHKSAPAERVM